MDFSRLAGVFAKMEETASRLELAAELAKLFCEAKPSEARHLTYLCQGIVEPEFTGIQLGVGDKLAEQAVSKVSGKGVKEVEAAYRKTGDLGETAEALLAKKSQGMLAVQTLSTEKVYANFHRIATLSGGGSQDSKVGMLAELLANSSPQEAKAVIRFAQGSLRLGIGEPTMLDALALVWLLQDARECTSVAVGEKSHFIRHGGTTVSSAKAGLFLAVETDAKNEDFGKVKKNAEAVLSGRREIKAAYAGMEGGKIRLDILEEKRARRETLERGFNLRSDLGLIAEMVCAGRAADVGKLEPAVFSPIRPALAERLLTPDDIVKKIGPCMAEGKYDGFRLQVHKKGREVRIFSRRQEPMTHMFPDVVEAVRAELHAGEAIFEGEAIAYDGKANRFLPFQVTIQRKRKHGVGEKARELPLLLFAFELLYADGKDYTRVPYGERRKALAALIHNGEGMLRLSEAVRVETGAQLQKFFEQCVGEGLEGIIAKDLRAPYTAGARKFAWIKLKKSYGKLTDTFDLVVVGYYLGKGKRAQFEFGGLLCAVYDTAGRRFRSIAKVGTGFTEKEMQEFQAALEKLAVKERPANVDSVIGADVWVRPAMVIEVNADEISRSPTHSAGKKEGSEEGLALRFPRMVGLRKDKRPEDATTEEEVLEMYEMQRQR
ncbi:MAG: ATP-dependent DNA ligase [Candidatus Micrarchaeota archaeon]